MTPNPIENACRLLREGAAELKNCHTLAATAHDWTGEPEAKAAYDEHTAAADALESLHAECEALRTGYAAARLEIESLRARCVEPVGERTTKDYAIEHAEYMAQDAERLLEAINHLNAQRDEDGEAFDSDALAHAEEAATEAFRAVRNGIYEFRKRRDRAAAQPAGAQQPGVATWMPLPGSLPEPGKPVLLDIGKKYPIRAMWAAKHTVQAADDDSDWGEYDEATDTYYCPEGWYEWNQHEDNHWAVTETPVAWCEIPPPGAKEMAL